MIQPESKNWINKYFSLIEEKKIDLNEVTAPDSIAKTEFLHTTFFKSGIVFGYPSQLIFYKEVNSIKWTSDERLAVLLFECLFMVYRTEKNSDSKEDFVSTLLDFYQQFDNKVSINVLKLFFKESDEVKLENILKQRTHVRKTLSNQIWVNYLSNNLIYIDVLAFRSFLLHQKQMKESYGEYVKAALYLVAAMSLVDDQIEKSEKKILSTFLSSSIFTETDRKSFKKRLKEKSITLADVHLPDEDDDLFKFYLVDMAILTIHSDLSTMTDEYVQLYSLCEYLSVDTQQLSNSIILIERFMIENNHQIKFLQEKSSYDELYGNFSKRWIKILGRNKDKFINELKDSKELIFLVNKSFQKELTLEEKEKVKNQFKELAKSMPALAIFMLPGGMILLPIILKIIPDLIPSAFQGNKIDIQKKEE